MIIIGMRIGIHLFHIHLDLSQYICFSPVAQRHDARPVARRQRVEFAVHDLLQRAQRFSPRALVTAVVRVAVTVATASRHLSVDVLVFLVLVQRNVGALLHNDFAAPDVPATTQGYCSRSVRPSHRPP